MQISPENSPQSDSTISIELAGVRAPSKRISIDFETFTNSYASTMRVHLQGNVTAECRYNESFRSYEASFHAQYAIHTAIACACRKMYTSSSKGNSSERLH